MDRPRGQRAGDDVLDDGCDRHGSSVAGFGDRAHHSVHHAAVALDGGNLTITAKAGKGADGAAGNAWSVTVADNNGALSVAVDTTNKVITINSDRDNSAGQQTSRLNVASALNNNSTFAGLFGATVGTAGSFGAAAANTSLAGGSTFFAIITGLTEGVDQADVEGTDFQLDTNGDATPEIAAASLVDVTNAHNGSLIVTFATTSPTIAITANTSRLRVVSDGFQDLSGLNTIAFPASIAIS